MSTVNIRKIKLLKLLEFLQHNTDEFHSLTAGQISKALAEIGVPFDPRTISQDISVLNSMGYEIMSVMNGHEKHYYVADRRFSVPELKILIDAVHAASFITEKKSDELINKIAALAGSHRAELLTRNMICFNTRKHNNEKIYYNVDALEDALTKHKKVLFRYFDLDECGNRIYRREGHRYVVEPIALIYNEDNYYLFSYSAKHNSTSNYRVDRMDSVSILDEACSDEALSLRSNVASYTEQSFKMYGGRIVEITLVFSKTLLGVVYDKFGENIQISLMENDRYSTTVKVQVSPVFWGWLFQFAGEMTLKSPSFLVAEYNDRAKKILNTNME